MRTEAWFVCRCGVKVARVGKGKFQESFRKHALVCTSPRGAATGIEQVPQRKR